MHGKDHTKDIYLKIYQYFEKRLIKIIQFTFLSMFNFYYTNAEEKQSCKYGILSII